MEGQERPFVMVGGRKYVLAEDEEYTMPDGPEPEIFQRLTGPPRSVSLTVRALLLLNNGHAPLFGWFFACFGMMFAIFFIPVGLHGLPDLTHRNFEPVGKGKVVQVAKTSITANDCPVYRFHFTGPNGEEGRCFAVGERFKEDAEVDLEKCGDRIRIVGTNFGSLGNSGFFVVPGVLLFPIIGMSIVLYGTFQGMKAIRLLHDGEVGRARFIDMKPTGTQVNGQSVMKLHYMFTAADGVEYDAYAMALDTDKLTDDPVEALLYDPMDSKKSVLLDSLPGNVRYDDMEQTFKANPLRAVLPLVFCSIFLIEVTLLVYATAVGGFLPIN